MRILYVFRSLAIWGGIERILVEKMNNLVRMYDYEVYMLTADQGEHPIPYQIDDGVHIEDLNIRFHLQFQHSGVNRLLDARKRSKRFERLLADRLRTIHPDIIVCTTDLYVNTLVRMKGDIPLVVEAHTNCIWTYHEGGLFQKFNNWRMRRSLKKVDILVALTQGDAEEWKRYCKHVIVIPNVVHLNPSGQSSDNTQKRVIYVGRFDERQKRVTDAICIWEKVHQLFPDWYLDIYGEGDDIEAVEHAVLRAGANICIHKPTKDIFDRYRESAFLILTSEFEPFGLVMPEAMSCGLPVVAFDCPYGPSGIITDGKDGFLVPLHDNVRFVECMSKLMSNLQLRQEMGQAAVDSSMKYSFEIIMPLWDDLFHKVISKKVFE